MRVRLPHTGPLLAGLLLFLAVTAQAVGASPRQWRTEGWTRTDFSKSAVDFREILSGGPPKDGIPSIDRPKFVPASTDSALGRKEPVISLELNGDARAYPLRVLIWHEIVNDTVGGIPVAVTYCPLCNSAVVFDRRFDGRVLDFGTTGKLRNSDLVMYDRQTETWWQQFTGEGIVGHYTGKALATFPARLESFERFLRRHPSGTLLVPNDPESRPYGRNPYVNYDIASRPFLYPGDLPKGINPMARVVVVGDRGAPSAVSLDLLRRSGMVRVGDITLTWEAGQNSALHAEVIREGRDVGNVLARRDTAQGRVDVRYDVTFAFVFHAFHPKRPIRTN